jgi:PhzF family phenazine biosynthesis protein
MSSPLPFQQVDVFTSVPFKGNPVAVVLDGNGLSTQAMQAIASWTNLSETTFVCTATDTRADYRLRIFTPRSELPFAGHPTIGSAHAVLRYGLKPKTAGRLIQECGKGLVTLALDDGRLFLSLPKPQLRDVPATRLEQMMAALGSAAGAVRAKAIVDVGVVWITLQLDSAEAVTRIQPDLTRVAAATPRGVAGVTVFGLAPGGGEVQLEVRSFAPAEGVPEDPVCGSGNGCVAALIRQERLISASAYVAGQGQCVARDGRVEVRYAEDGTIWLGGRAVTCLVGMLEAGDADRPHA